MAFRTPKESHWLCFLGQSVQFWMENVWQEEILGDMTEWTLHG
jgi:hypothetical protein